MIFILRKAQPSRWAFSFLEHSLQNHDSVPGVSGWKLDPLKGEFEINSCTIGSVSKTPERQMVSVEVASYGKYDLPKNAAKLLQFMQAELQKVPEEYRHAAEFEDFDASYGDDSFSPRLFLSYWRLETEDELADRLQKAKGAGIQIKSDGGVTTFSHDGVLRIRIGNLAALEPEHCKSADIWSVKMQLNAQGQYVAAGIGVGSDLVRRPDIIVKPANIEFLSDGTIKIKQSAD
ncbi:DUF1983 domain-containing protein [Pseudomonas sp. MCal1]|uniref:DUF1983 domain-containing protein n=1 Tax=Pseudomonas sp. MCal1 TaxID=2919887 RepID=UPI00224D4A13|nr:DUF1983 domain-containing protein [Pseudomonas sp. MCal1]MCX4217415.1 DUF1983 domain-containing protein [Pseudomonas sp. MCal1]